jgi:hypothetical protein
MISCKNVAKLLMADELRAQPWWKRMEVRLHLAMCDLCSRLARQLSHLSAGARQMNCDVDADPDLEDRLIRRILRK